MNVLVDYDNIRKEQSRKGLVYVVDRVLQAVGAKDILPTEVGMKCERSLGVRRASLPKSRRSVLA